MATIELTHKELSKLIFSVATTRCTIWSQTKPPPTDETLKFLKELETKLSNVIDNNYNDREEPKNDKS